MKSFKTVYNMLKQFSSVDNVLTFVQALAIVVIFGSILAIYLLYDEPEQSKQEIVYVNSSELVYLDLDAILRSETTYRPMITSSSELAVYFDRDKRNMIILPKTPETARWRDSIVYEYRLLTMATPYNRRSVRKLTHSSLNILGGYGSIAENCSQHFVQYVKQQISERP